VTPSLLAAAAENREASPIALVVILCLATAVVLLIRSMNRHLRKVSTSFPERPPGASGRPTGVPERADAPPEEELGR
jgi:hypothetical protein